MNKTGRLPAALLLLLSASLLVSAPTGFSGKTPGQELPQRSIFYAVEVVFEDRVQSADDALGPPDDSLAQILPGGQLVLLMQKLLSPSLISGYGENAGCLDSGSVAGKGEMNFRLEGRFLWHDTEGEKRHEWISLMPSATGFCLSPPPLAAYSPEDNAGVDMVKITNSGTNSLFVDAVVGFEWMF